MFRQPKKHAASTSSKGNDETSKNVLIYPTFLSFPYCIYDSKVLAYNVGDSQVEIEFGLIVPEDPDDRVLGISGFFGIEKDAQPSIFVPYFEQISDEMIDGFGDCSEGIFAEYIETLKKHKGSYLLLAKATGISGHIEDVGPDEYGDIFFADSGEMLAKNVTCVCRPNGDEFIAGCCSNSD